MVANYWGGSFAVLALGEDGSIGAKTAFIQNEAPANRSGDAARPHGHWLAPDHSGRFLLAIDLGRDEVATYKFDGAAGTLSARPVAVYPFPPGAGPRHAAFVGDGRRVVVAGELNSTLTQLEYQPETGSLGNGQALSTLPQGFAGENAVAEVAVTPDGRYAYVSNRGHNSIAVFRLGGDGGRLAGVGFSPSGGNWPRHFAIDPSGRCLVVANQRSDEVVAFRRASDSGMLGDRGPKFRLPAPTSIAIVGGNSQDQR
jgi:6-phosphogluconolactonase